MANQEGAPKTAKGFEEALWDSANRLRGSVFESLNCYWAIWITYEKRLFCVL